METEELKETAEDLATHVGDLADTFYRLTAIKVAQKASSIASVGISSLWIGILALFVLLFGGMAAGWWLGDIIHDRAGGFLIIAGFFLLLAVCLVLLRKKLVIPFLRNLIIRKMYE